MKLLRTALLLTFSGSVIVASGCGGVFDSLFGNGDDDRDDKGAGNGSSSGFGGNEGTDSPDAKPCTGLCLRQKQCASGTTSLSGTVKDPAGKVPLYNVLVYVPNAPVESLSNGASCDRCGSVSGDPLVTALTGVDGRFKLDNVPVGKDIPLVVQIGKWRRQLVVPNVPECVDTALSDGDIRLPRKQSEGDLPQIALTTGGADVMECWLRKVGIDDSEFTTATGQGKVHFYRGRGMNSRGTDVTSRFDDAQKGRFSDAQSFWSSQANLMKYDMVILSCEGLTHPETKPPAALGAMKAYADAGGRIFASHWHRYWFDTSEHREDDTFEPAGPSPSPFEPVATWRDRNAPCGPGGGCRNSGTIVTSFPKGQAMKSWLDQPAVGALQDGRLPIEDPRHNVDVVDANKATTWITVPNDSAPNKTAVEYLSFNTPVPAPEDQKCGRVVYNDLHVTTQDTAGPAWPNGCKTSELTPQEKALEFMLFDLSSCIQSDKEAPVPPTVVK